MTSERKIRANRANAWASTGPKTAQGGSHSARNALRHALSLPVYSASERRSAGSRPNPLMVDVPNSVLLKPGDRVGLAIDPTAMRLLPPDPV